MWDSSLTTKLNQRYGTLGALPTGDPELAVARNAARQTVALQDQLARSAAGRRRTAAAPTTEPAASRC